MRIAYANALYKSNDINGGNVHVYQFITLASTMGHEVWTWPGDQHPVSNKLPKNRISRFKVLRHVDVLYYRLEDRLPSTRRLMDQPFYRMIGSPVVVWEFNAPPEFGELLGLSQSEVQKSIRTLKKYARGCDLAVCVSEMLASYTKQKLGIKNAIIVPNGSAPDIFRPDLSPLEHIHRGQENLNVAWIGSADLNWHDLELLRRTASQIWDSPHAERINFHLIGQGLRDQFNSPPNLIFHGPVRYEELPRWLASMDIGLILYSPGIADYNSPLKMFDYMASGLMIIGTKHPQIRKIYQELGQGEEYLIPSGNSDYLAKLLLELASDRGRINKYGKRGRRLVNEFYNWGRAVEDTLDEIDKLLKA